MKCLLLLAITAFFLLPAHAQPDTAGRIMKQLEPPKNFQLGVIVGTGISKLRISLSNWQQGSINYSDSLKDINSRSLVAFSLGFVFHWKVHQHIAFRPTVCFGFEGGDLVYERHTSTDLLEIRNVNTSVALPLILRFKSGPYSPYVSLGPSFLFMIGEDESMMEKLSLRRTDLFGECAIGWDLPSATLQAIVAPQLRFGFGLFNIKKDRNNLFANTLGSIRRQQIELSISLRGNVKEKQKN